MIVSVKVKRLFFTKEIFCCCLNRNFLVAQSARTGVSRISNISISPKLIEKSVNSEFQLLRNRQ